MAEPFRDETGVKEFLMATWASYAPDGDAVGREIPQPDGSRVGTVVDGSWKMVTTHHSNPAKTHFNGREVVFKDDVPVWATNCHGVISDEALVDALCDFWCDHLAAHPDPEFPIVALMGGIDEDKRFYYTRTSTTGGRLTVARFAVVEEIQDKQANYTPVLNSHSIGGWIS